MTSEERSRVSVRVHGRVQGVGFRYFVCELASRLGLAGSVRNAPDGTVELEASGPLKALEQLVEAMRRGPTGAHVTSVDVLWDPGAGPGGETGSGERSGRFIVRY